MSFRIWRFRPLLHNEPTALLGVEVERIRGNGFGHLTNLRLYVAEHLAT